MKFNYKVKYLKEVYWKKYVLVDGEWLSEIEILIKEIGYLSPVIRDIKFGEGMLVSS
jgi:hypothetical protein